MKLSMSQKKVLKVLGSAKPMTAAEVAAKLKSKAGPLTRSLMVLESHYLAKSTGNGVNWKRTAAGTKALKALAK